MFDWWFDAGGLIPSLWIGVCLSCAASTVIYHVLIPPNYLQMSFRSKVGCSLIASVDTDEWFGRKERPWVKEGFAHAPWYGVVTSLALTFILWNSFKVLDYQKWVYFWFFFLIQAVLYSFLLMYCSTVFLTTAAFQLQFGFFFSKMWFQAILYMHSYCNCSCFLQLSMHFAQSVTCPKYNMNVLSILVKRSL